MTSALEKRQAKRAELIRRLASLAPKKKLDSMLEEVDGRALVRSLPAADVYATIIDVGLADSTEVVQLASAEQFQAFVDLAAWQKDRVDCLEVLHWIRAARGDDDRAFMAKIQKLDIEVLELMFRRMTRIHQLEENPDVDLEGFPVETPDGKFIIELMLEGVDEAALRRLTFDLIANNPFELSRFLEAVRWELPSDLEEAAYQFRQSRLEGLGFPPLEQALKVFSPVNLDVVKRSIAQRAELANPEKSVDYVAEAFAQLDAIERDNLEMEVRHVVNCVLVAEGAEPGDPAALRKFSEETRDQLCLALEFLTSADAAEAGEVVRRLSLSEVFRVGHTLTLSVRREAQRVLKLPHVQFAETIMALDDEAATLKALLKRRPKKALKVPGADPVPFRTQRELAEAKNSLERLVAHSQVFHALCGDSLSQAVSGFGAKLADLTPQRLFLATVCMAESEGVVDAVPFPTLQLAGLLERLFEDSKPLAKLRPSAGERAVGLLVEKLGLERALLQSMVASALSVLLTEVQSCWSDGRRVEASKLLSLPIAGEIVV